MLYENIQEAKTYIQSRCSSKPNTGIVLGTGLDELVNEMEISYEINYEEIPYFPASTVEGHQGKLIFGQIASKDIVLMAGRFHFYEGYSHRELTFPVRVLKALGIQRLFLTNVSGSINEKIDKGDFVILKDHINFHPDNPLRGVNDDRLGPRFPDMSNAYDKAFISTALKLASKQGLRAHVGIYIATAGPNLETPAEYAFFNTIGGDVVGMSTVPEVIVASQMALPVFAVSVVSNKCYPIDEITETTLEEVLALAREAGPHLSSFLTAMIASN